MFLKNQPIFSIQERYKFEFPGIRGRESVNNVELNLRTSNKARKKQGNN